jgi:ABC-type transporter Mla MlaB component
VSPTDPGVLAIAGALTVASVPARFRELRAAAAEAAVFDLGAVDAIDSAGVAMIQALRGIAERRHGRRPALRALPERFRQLCIAHRVELNGH